MSKVFSPTTDCFHTFVIVSHQMKYELECSCTNYVFRPQFLSSAMNLTNFLAAVNFFLFFIPVAEYRKLLHIQELVYQNQMGMELLPLQLQLCFHNLAWDTVLQPKGLCMMI